MFIYFCVIFAPYCELRTNPESQSTNSLLDWLSRKELSFLLLIFPAHILTHRHTHSTITPANNLPIVVNNIKLALLLPLLQFYVDLNQTDLRMRREKSNVQVRHTHRK